MYTAIERMSAGVLRMPVCFLVIVAGIAAWGLTPMGGLGVVHAANLTSCTPQATLPADMGSTSFTGMWNYATVIQKFDSARAAESPVSCTVKLEDQFAAKRINATVWSAATPQQQMLWLFNAERTARGLGILTLDPNLMSRVDYNHSLEMKQYTYFNHPSPINHPGWNHVFDRLTGNPAIGGHWSYVGENIAYNFPDAAQATYFYMYHDSNPNPAESWGHRKNILGYNSGTFGNFNWVGIGVVDSGPAFSGGPDGYFYSSDFMQSSNYQMPAAADTQTPTMAPPTLICNSNGTLTVQVSPSDTGAVAGEAGVSDVVVSVGKASQNSSGIANTTELLPVASGSTTWAVTLPSKNVNLSNIHVVATDGSGNFTDVQSITTSCGTPPVATITLSKSTGVFGAGITVWGTHFPDGTVKLYWDNGAGTPFTTATASNGSFSKYISIGNLAGGSHTFIASSGSTSAHAPFTMAPSIRITPASGLHTLKPTVNGHGFQNGEAIVLHWMCNTSVCTGSVLVTLPVAVIASVNGTFTDVKVTLPAGVHTQMKYMVGAVGGSGSFADNSFYVSG